MAVTKDYIFWRGDIPFYMSPAAEADEFLICMMGMFDLRHVVPEDGAYISMRRALELYLANEARYARLATSFPERAERLFAENEANAKERFEHLQKLKALYE